LITKGPQVTRGQPCSSTIGCLIVYGLICSSGTCQCPSGYYWDNTNGCRNLFSLFFEFFVDCSNFNCFFWKLLRKLTLYHVRPQLNVLDRLDFIARLLEIFAIVQQLCQLANVIVLLRNISTPFFIPAVILAYSK